MRYFVNSNYDIEKTQRKELSDMVKFAKVFIPHSYVPNHNFDEMLIVTDPEMPNRSSFAKDVEKADLYELVNQIA